MDVSTLEEVAARNAAAWESAERVAMTRTEALELIDSYEADPDGVDTCDALCAVLDALPGQPEGEYTADEVRDLVEELLDDDLEQETA